MSQHPQINAQWAWTVACTVCDWDSYAGQVPSFGTEQQMWSAILSPHSYGWTRRDDGRVLCRHHSAVADCDADGHQTSPWTEHPLDADLDWRFCVRCGGEFEQRVAWANGDAGGALSFQRTAQARRRT
jgi:hypothetical protein